MAKIIIVFSDKIANLVIVFSDKISNLVIVYSDILNQFSSEFLNFPLLGSFFLRHYMLD